MIVITVDSVTHEDEKKMRSILTSCSNVISINSEPRYDNFSSVLSCIADFFNVITTSKTHDKMYVFPVSIISLYNTEMYDVVVNLTKLMFSKIPPVRNISVLIDGDENSMLEYIFNTRQKTLISLEELKERRDMIRGVNPVDYFISDDVSVIHTDDMHDILQKMTAVVNRQT